MKLFNKLKSINWPRVVARSLSIILAVTFVSLLIWFMYIKPMSEVKGVTVWYEYIFVFIMFTVVYIIVGFMMSLVGKLIDWIVDNLN
jgi:hypothetical protein